MKKIISTILVIVTVLAIAITTVTAYDRGDANKDGKIDNKDVVYLFRLISSHINFTYDEVMDYNGDGQIDNKDVVSLFREISKINDTICEHEWSDWTFKETGIEERTCWFCGETETREMDQAACQHEHEIGEGTRIKDPTCLEEGEEIHTCIKCGATYSVTVPASGHDLQDKVIKEPTTTEEGIRYWWCLYCDYEYTEPIEKLTEKENPWEGTYITGSHSSVPGRTTYGIIFDGDEGAHYAVIDLRTTWGAPPELTRTGENEVTVNWIGINGEKLQVVMYGFDPQTMMGVILKLYEDGTYEWLYTMPYIPS